MSAEGFHDDCIDLINEYCSRNSTDFQLFCDIWKEKGFHYVFYGHTHQHELLLYTENCFVILKNIFTGSTTIGERLATLYLMYAMYFKQPTKDFCKFRYTLNDWTRMKNFCDAIYIEPKYLQARAIFWRLYQSNAFRFVECDMEHYPESMQLHRLGNDCFGDFQKINSTILATVNDLQNESKGLMSAIGTLQLGYNEMKDHFAANMNECAHMQSIDVIEGVGSQLDKVKKLFENKYDSRYTRRKRQATAGPSRRAKECETTDYDTELNASYSSYSESNDDSVSERSDDDTMDGACLNIGSRRYYLKRNALQNEVGGLHQLKSTVIATRSSPRKKNKLAAPKETEATTSNQPSRSTSVMSSPPEKSRVSIDNTSGNIVINRRQKVYNRHSKQYVSSVRKQFTDCPSEVSEEVDMRSPRKHAKLK
ncbi:uncharacterized protein LOC129576844 [Sitodiplosis mosellana]|uniref:uncharacterized protein LOC129576844 n=1 Tax=Sitodiplosis mosellana TaxID=263140 RepID=UPI002443D388|nr:uncharacterized protein LOC129576844 [Sitodiplosis mosellana]